MSASAAAAIEAANLELHCCPSIEGTRREEGVSTLTTLLKRFGYDHLNVDAHQGCRNDTVYGLLSGHFDRDELDEIGISVRGTFGSGYAVLLVDSHTHDILYSQKATS